VAQARCGRWWRYGAHWERLSERQSQHSEVASGVNSPSPEIDPWDRSDMGVVDVASLLDFIHALRLLVDAEEQRLCQCWAPGEESQFLPLEEYRAIFPDGP